MATVTYFVYGAALGTRAWAKTKENQLRPVVGETLHMETPGLVVEVHHVARDLDPEIHYAYCQALSPLDEPEKPDGNYFLVKHGWKKEPVPKRLQLAIH